jgi:hypothetical protein
MPDSLQTSLKQEADWMTLENRMGSREVGGSPVPQFARRSLLARLQKQC